MIVECKYNKISEIRNPEYSSHIEKYIHQSEVALCVGAKYTVYGLSFREGFPWYYICEEEADEYPHPHFAGFFDVIHSQLSSSWRLSWAPDVFESAFMLPKEWAENRMFYEHLVNGKEFEKLEFQRLKYILDSESNI